MVAEAQIVEVEQLILEMFLQLAAVGEHQETGAEHQMLEQMAVEVVDTDTIQIQEHIYL